MKKTSILGVFPLFWKHPNPDITAPFCFKSADEELYLAASCPSSRGLHLFTPDAIDK